MNIQRFKWPALIAAGFHSALFISLQDPAAGLVQPPLKTSLPPFRPDHLVELAEQVPDSPDALSTSRGGPAVPDLPEPLVVPLTNRPEISVPIVDHRTTAVTTLVDYHGSQPSDGTFLGPGVSSRIYSPDKLDRIPRATVQIAPDYPPTMRAEGVAGSVVVEFDVNAEGRVVRAEAVHTTRREFAPAAVRAVLKWQFEPGKRNGRPVPFRMTVPIDFTVGAD